MLTIPLKTQGLTIYETNGGDPVYRKKMLDLYAETFPEYAYYLPYMDYRMSLPVDADPLFIERWWLIEIDEEPVALRLFKYSPSRRCALVLGTAIKPQFRKHPVPGYPRLLPYLIDLSIEQIETDAISLGQPLPAGFVSEFQLPEPGMSREEASYHQHIIERYRELGCVDLPVDYFEPPYIVGRERFVSNVAPDALSFNHMMFSILPLQRGDFDIHDRKQITDFALAFLVDHYRLSEDHWAVRRALESIERYYGNSTHD